MFPFNTDSNELTIERIIQQAQNWGFICQQHLSDCSICPFTENCRGSAQSEFWQLQLEPEGWLLLIDGMPQMLMLPSQVLKFLQRQYRKQQAIAA